MSSLIGSNSLGGLVGSELLGSGSVRLAGSEVPGGVSPTPTPIPGAGLLFVFDAAIGVTKDSGGNVTDWADQSGNGNDLRALAVPPVFKASSINGQPGVSCSGLANQGMHNTSVALTANNAPRTLVSVIKPSTALAQVLFDWRTGVHDFYQAIGFAGSGFVYGNSISNANVSAGLLLADPVVVFHLSDGVNIRVIYNGAELTVGTSGTAGGDTGPAGFTSMCLYDGSLSLLGDNCYQAGWNRELTASEISEVGGLLQRRFLIPIYSQLTMSTDSLRIAPSASKTFVAHGGAGVYIFGLSQNNSGGFINAGTGLYTAGAVAGVVDVVRVTDSAGFSYTLNISVSAAPATTHLTNAARLLTVGDSTTTLLTPAWWNPVFFTDVNGALSPGSVVHLEQGHPGATAADVLINFTSWITLQTPDVVYLTVGINDVNNLVAPYTFASEISLIVQKILSITTATKIVITSITCFGEVWSAGPVWGPNLPNFDASIDVFNCAAESIVNGLGNANVVFVNFRQQLLQWEVINNPLAQNIGHATSDGIHPSIAGAAAESGFAFAQVVAP